MQPKPSNVRTRRIAKLHCLKRDLGLDDDTYRDVLEQVSGKRSAAELDDAELDRVIERLARDAGGGSYPGKPGNMKGANAPPELRKIEALLADAKRPWAYADGIAKQMFKMERVAWCKPKQLRAVIAALMVNAKRRKEKPQIEDQKEKCDVCGEVPNAFDSCDKCGYVMCEDCKDEGCPDCTRSAS